MNTLLEDVSKEEYFFLPDDDNYNTIENHAFSFRDDRWDLSPLILYSETKCHNQKIIDFSDLPESIREIVKRHTYHELSRVKPQSAIQRSSMGKTDLKKFMEEFGIVSFEQFDTERYLAYNAWLRQIYITDTEKPWNEQSLYLKALFLKQLLDRATLLEWKGAPKEPIVLGDITLMEIWGMSNKKSGEKQKKRAEARVIPNSIWNTIIRAARDECQYRIQRNAEVVYSSGEAKGIRAVNFRKYLILTLAFTGLRISEVATLTRGCVFQCRWERHWLRRTTSKTVPEPQEGDIRIPKELFNALKELEEITESYKLYSGINRLFFTVDLKNNSKIGILTESSIKASLLRGFRKDHNFCDTNGYPYHFTPHDFRHTFASKLVNEHNVSLTTLMRHYAHVSLEMTSHYTHLSKEKLKKRALAGFIYTDKIIAGGKEGEEFIKRLNEAKAEQDIDAAIAKLSDAFGINSLPFGLCVYDYRRGHCPNLGVQSCWEIGCKDFVTSSSFLQNFEHERDTLKIQIERDKHLGQIACAKMKSIKYGKLVKIIGELTVSENLNV